MVKCSTPGAIEFLGWEESAEGASVRVVSALARAGSESAELGREGAGPGLDEER
jgi:hypothetical protein